MDSGLAEVLLEHGPDPLLLLDPDGSISFLNTAAEELFGSSRSQLLGTDPGLLVAEACRADFRSLLAALLTGPGSPTPRPGQPRPARSFAGPFAGSGRRADGTEIPVDITCWTLPASAVPGRSAPSVALSVRNAGRCREPSGTRPYDAGTTAGGAAPRRRTPAAPEAVPESVPGAVTEHDDELRAGVLRDALTGLPNGTLFNERLAAALRRPDPVDVLLLSLDDFTHLSGRLGRSATDELLVELARRLRNCVRPHDTVARLGGNEFVVLLTECLNADVVATRITASLQEPLRVGGSVVRPGLSMGLASRTGGTLDGAELLRQADAAMTAATTAAGATGRWQRFRPEMLGPHAAGADGGTGLRRAVELGQISVHYQPVVSTGPGAVVQFEAFARWEDHGRTARPQEFLPAAEQGGLIPEIGDEVLRRACTEMRPWLAGSPACSVAVNVSALQLRQRDFAAGVLAIVASAGVDPRQLVLDLTASVFFDAGSDVLRQLRSVREAGVRIAMDCFGPAYSALDRLAGLPLDKVKIDSSLVALIQTGEEQLPYFGTVINAAHALGLKVTAEGIETPAQARYLLHRGCDSLQGYLFARPAPAGELAGMMESALAAIGTLDAGR
ncbi:diguanylate cyclase (GGDEF)-like protein/PAS domain S-box-containing protein [Arthrobacter ginsengisoli]|uniref:Diguanylate cyclase (GGDEF)-like protein/PAS domain S-box-containing protein n=1 Tax=Arthrobacter ginsengisoli TaxID=1356565 RepID=A0ABU1U7N8_9MICC|nr:GGDEF domain-containing protein [Arthrobacter ginsengisoli]MDR7081174.1 diguanylate cyclase (GGDEF)-like protein/PAS domain S-box-containing protein [Arthrobacter ginsengisoli]